MATIWKFPIVPYDEHGMITARPVIDMPYGARILALQTQDGTPTLWALVDPRSPLAPRTFLITFTGYTVPDDAGRYVGTWQSDLFVFHLFEAQAAD